MTADALKSASITNLDATPVVQNTAGQGAPGALKMVDDVVTPTALGLADTTSTYKMVRVPTTIKLKELRLFVTTAIDSGSPSLTVDVGLYYSDSTVDGTPSALQGTAVNDNLFADAIAFGYTTNMDINVLTNFSPDKREKQLWDAAGLSTDPGGMFDIVVTVEAAANTAASHPMGLSAKYVW